MCLEDGEGGEVLRRSFLPRAKLGRHAESSHAREWGRDRREAVVSFHADECSSYFCMLIRLVAQEISSYPQLTYHQRMLLPQASPVQSWR